MNVTQEQFEELRGDVRALGKAVRSLQISTEFATYYFKRVAEAMGIMTQDLDDRLERAMSEATGDLPRADPEVPTNPLASERPQE